MIWVVAGALAAPLELGTVLAEVDARIPQLAAAEAKIAAAEGKLLATRGAFDPTLVGKGGAYGGKDPRQVADVAIVAQSVLGPTLSVGWTYGQGSFPTYDDRETGETGDVTVGATVPLLQGLVWGADRAALAVADATVDAAGADLDTKRLDIRRKAAEAWWKWAGAGAKLGLERELLRLAEDRQAGLERLVQEGALPRLDALDHQRVVLERRAAALKAEQELIVSSVLLSLWYRTADGAPIVPSEDELPPLPRPTPSESVDDVARALARRPELVALAARIDAAEAELKAAGNLRLPALDAVGSADQGKDTELYVGMQLKAPLPQRKGRGSVAAAQATLDALQAERTGMTDQVRAEVVAARAARDLAARRAGDLQDAAALAAEVARLEQRAFTLGASDMFRVLARETKLGEAGRKAFEEQVGWGLAAAAYEAIVGGP